MQFGSATIELIQGDITKERVDAIVNAANAGLVGGGGVDGAIHKAGGPEIMAECEKIRHKQGGCPTGTAVKTKAGNLQAKAVIHSAGPIFREYSLDEADRLLKNCYQSCLEIARESTFRSVAFPSISTGVYGFPIERAAPIALETVADFCIRHDCFYLVRFVLFSPDDLEVYQSAAEDLKAYSPDLE